METIVLEKTVSLIVLNEEYGRHNVLGKAILKFWPSGNINFRILGQENFFDWTGRISKIWINSGYIHWITNEDEYSLYFGDHLEVVKELNEFFNKSQNNAPEGRKNDFFQLFSLNRPEDSWKDKEENISDPCQNPVGLPPSSGEGTERIIDHRLRQKRYEKGEGTKLYPVWQKRNPINYQGRIWRYKKSDNKFTILKRRKYATWNRYSLILSRRPKTTQLNTGYQRRISLSKNNDKLGKKIVQSTARTKRKNICLCLTATTVLISLSFAYILFYCCDLEYIPDQF